MKKIINVIVVLSLLLNFVIPSFNKTSAQVTEKSNSVEQTEEPLKGEIKDERSANSKTFYLGDGLYEKQLFQNPIHKQTNNEWHEVSTDLIESKREEITTEETFLVPTFLQEMENGRYVDYQINSNNFSFSLLHAFNEKGEKVEVDNVKAVYKEQDNTITYPKVFPEIDLRHITFESNSKEDLVLTEYLGFHKFIYQIETQLSAFENQDQSISFKDSNGKEQFNLPKPFMEDSNIDEEKGEAARSDEVRYELTPNEKGYLLSVVADPNWLKSENRKFPVYIDPTTSVASNVDTFVTSAYPAANYSSSTSKWDSTQNQYVLKVGNYDSTTVQIILLSNKNLNH